MTDELTPEENKAMSSLPRERMPAGLEARVVDSMRDRGFLEKQRRRTIDITNSRLTGLLAACVALMIGAYSIGLQRGESDTLRPRVATLEQKDSERVEEPAIDAAKKQADRPAPAKTLDAEQPASDMPRESDRLTFNEARQELVGQDRADQDVADEVTADRDQKFEAKGKELTVRAGREVAATPQALEEESVGRIQPRRSKAASETPVSTPALSRQPQTFLLNGFRVVVDAPDSVRVTQDDDGKMLLIYTSDGVIRVRPTDD